MYLRWGVIINKKVLYKIQKALDFEVIDTIRKIISLVLKSEGVIQKVYHLFKNEN